MLTLLLLTTQVWAAHPKAKTPPPIPSMGMYKKIAALWRGNSALYCDRTRAVDATLKEIRQLHQVKTASYEPRGEEIQFTCRDGTHASIDVGKTLPPRAGELCLRE